MSREVFLFGLECVHVCKVSHPKVPHFDVGCGSGIGSGIGSGSGSHRPQFGLKFGPQ